MSEFDAMRAKHPEIDTRFKEQCDKWIPEIQAAYGISVSETELADIGAIRIYAVSGIPSGDVLGEIGQGIERVRKSIANRRLIEQATRAEADDKSKAELTEKLSSMNPNQKLSFARSSGDRGTPSRVREGREPTAAEAAQMAAFSNPRQALSYAQQRGIRVL